jgi:hypothetical protein
MNEHPTDMKVLLYYRFQSSHWVWNRTVKERKEERSLKEEMKKENGRKIKNKG